MREPDGPDTEWAVVGRGTDLAAGPRRAFGQEHVRASVRVDPALGELPLGAALRTVTVAESGVRSFEVVWHESAEGTVAVNPAGGNRVGWTDPRHLSVTPVDSGHLTSVHVRFLLRHLTTGLLAADLGAAPVHAVTAQLAGGGVLAVAGPTQSGKTRLVNRLLAAGHVTEVVDDDCPLLAPDGRCASLVPRRYELVRSRRDALVALVLLDGSVAAPGPAPDPVRFLAQTPVPWPCSWLPGEELPPVPQLPAVPTWAVPARDEDAAEEVAALIRRRRR